MTPAAAPLLVRLEGRRVVGVGGGAVASAKLLPLGREHGAQLVVIAPQIAPDLAAVARCHRRDYSGAADLHGAALVVAASDSPRVNAAVARDADGLGIWCVRTDAAADGTAEIPAVVRRGALTIAVATGGQSPTVARWLREDLETRYGREYGDLVDVLGQLRRNPTIQQHLAALDSEQRRVAWRSIPLVDILDLLRTGSVESAKEVAAACLLSFSD